MKFLTTGNHIFALFTAPFSYLTVVSQLVKACSLNLTQALARPPLLLFDDH